MKVRVERNGNRIVLSSDRPTPGLKSAIPGAYFRKDGLWSVPLDLTTCHLLRDRFGQRLEIGPLLTAWAREEKAGRERQAATAAAYDADLHILPEVAPVLAQAMGSRTYQRAAARFVADSRGRDDRRRALIADTVGLGKTAEAMAAVLESGVPGPYLIVCPKTAVEVAWTPEFRKWLPDARVVTIPEGRAKREEILWDLVYGPEVYEGQDIRDTEAALERYEPTLARTWVIVHPAAVRTQSYWSCGQCGSEMKYKSGIIRELDCGHEKGRSPLLHRHEYPQLFSMEWGAVIADESDQMLIRKTGTPNLQRRGMEMLADRVKPGGCRIAMSGTPFRSKPHQIWSTLNWLDPVRFSSKWNFLGKYWALGGYSGYELGDFIEEREGLLLDELKDIMIRRTREEVRGDLPAKLYPSNVPDDGLLTPGIYLPMTLKQRKAYDAMEKTASVDLEGGELNAIGILAELTRLKQFAGATGAIDPRTGEFHPLAEGNKFEWIVEFLQELGFPDQPSGKIVIASQFTQLLNAFAVGVADEFKSNNRYWLNYGMVTGEIAGPRRTQVIKEFEDVNDPLSILYINTKAGGSAITLDAADVMVILDETWVDDEQQQLEGRIDNRNPERKIVPRSYYYLRSLNSVEEGIAAGNAAAKERSARLLDGNRSSAKEFARSALQRSH